MPEVAQFDRPRLRLRQCDQLLDGLDRRRWMREQDRRRGAEHADRHELLHRVEARLVRAIVGYGDRRLAEEQRVAVGGRLDHRRHADDAAAARTPLDHDRLAETLAELFAGDARQRIADAASGESLDDADRPGGELVRGMDIVHERQRARESEREREDSAAWH